MKTFENQLKMAALTAVFLVSLAWAGCGGGGGDDGGGAPAAGGNPPESLSGQQFAVQDLNGPTAQQWRFSNEGIWEEFTSGVRTRTGPYQYTKGGGGTATLLLTDQSASNETINVSMRFTNNTSGTFTFTTTPSHNSGAGFFSGLMATPAPGDNGGGGTPTTGNPTNNFAPVSLIGRTLLGTRTETSTGTAGQTHTYTFGVSDFRDQDPPEEGIGVYTYTPNGDTANLLLNYTASSPGGRSLAGDQHNLQMLFASTNQGTFTSTYRSSNDVISINGTFILQ